MQRQQGDAQHGFQLRSYTIGPLPIVNALLDRLGVNDLLDQAVATDPRAKLSPARTLGVLLRTIVCERAPLYALAEWAADRDAAVLGLPTDGAKVLNDDRLGRALDRLFDADRATLTSAVALSAIRRFGIALDELHNDSTSITLQGSYSKATGQMVRGQRTAQVIRGHSKDYRPDLKQLLWVLTVAADGAVPVHYRVYDGNTSDVEPHTEIWDTLVKLVGRADFLYVADSKLATRENMDHIASLKGRFLTVLPRTRSEDADFRAWVQDHRPEWVLVKNRETTLEGIPDAYFMCEAPWPSAEGYRVVWVLSSTKRHHDAESRRARLRRATEGLESLTERLSGPKARIRTKAGADQAAQAILAETHTPPFFEIRLEERPEPTFQQENPGRPSSHTRYRRADRTRIALSWKILDDQVAATAASDGMFPFITNDRQLSLSELLDRYKYQPCLERRHEQLKSGLEVVPMWLKSIARIEAILLLYYIALLVRALLEREIRRRMKDEDLAALPLYPEERSCRAPSAERILAIFSPLQRHELVAGGRTIQNFQPQLSLTQQRVLRLLGLPYSIYDAS